MCGLNTYFVITLSCFTGWSRVHVFFLVIEWIKVVFCCNFYDIYWSQDISSMGGACSRKRDQLDHEDSLNRGVCERYHKSLSSKWLMTSFSRPQLEIQRGQGKCPSLMELCAHKIREVFCFHIMLGRRPQQFFQWLIFDLLTYQDIDRYNTFSMLPRDISQQIFNELVYSQSLTDISLEAFRDCALQVIPSMILWLMVLKLLWWLCYCP